MTQRALGIRRVDDVTHVERTVIETLGTGASGIKLSGDLPAGLLSAIVEAAHENGLKVWSHAALLPALPSDVVQAGVDMMTHAELFLWEAVDSLPPWDVEILFGEALLDSNDWRAQVADLVVLRSDPSERIEHLQSVHMVIRKGGIARPDAGAPLPGGGQR